MSENTTSRPRPELGGNLLGPKPTFLPDELDRPVREREGDDPKKVAADHPTSPLAWALLAQESSADGDTIEAYAFARVGYHRGLDALRRAGWREKGQEGSQGERAGGSDQAGQGPARRWQGR
ncbi:MAG: DUF3151 family protein [Dermabacter sp.]|nr:DUF3151 family protein [Dermabacter sp.]